MVQRQQLLAVKNKKRDKNNVNRLFSAVVKIGCGMYSKSNLCVKALVCRGFPLEGLRHRT